MDIINLKIEDLQPYEHNARHHEEKDLEAIEASIREFGFNDPIGIWGEKNVIVEGHGRLMAAKNIGLQEVPCIRLDHLTDEQRRAYALAHNKTAELSRWDFDVLNAELISVEDLDMNLFGFDVKGDWFQNRTRYDNEGESTKGEQYQEFVKKFEEPRTTDDCYTPDIVYNAIAEWVANEYSLKRSDFVRPFYPGGDYQREKYKPEDVVVDNPPFSIFSEIISFYMEKGIRFFLFGPTLTLFSSSSSSSCTALPIGASIIYENGAAVNTSFITNLEDEKLRIKTAPELYRIIVKAVEEEQKDKKATVPKYEYPDNIVTSALIAHWCKYGVEYKLEKKDCVQIDALDEQKEVGKAIFGKGYLLSERAAAERAAAERAAAERAAAERAAAEKWQLSEREKAIVRTLG